MRVHFGFLIVFLRKNAMVIGTRALSGRRLRGAQAPLSDVATMVVAGLSTKQHSRSAWPQQMMSPRQVFLLLL